MKKLTYLFVILILASGCATGYNSSFINYSKIAYPSQKEDYPIDMFFQDKPQKPYEVIGEIIGTVVKGEEVRPMLEAKTRETGGDGVIDIVTSQGTMTRTGVKHELINPGESYETRPVAVTKSYFVITVRGKVIKYKTTTP